MQDDKQAGVGDSRKAATSWRKTLYLGAFREDAAEF